MNTTSHAKLLDRKEKAKKYSLQWYFSAQAANEGIVHTISDRRDMGVQTTTKNNDKKMTAGTSGQKAASSCDGLLGSLLLEQIVGSALGPLLPIFMQSIDISNVVDAVDEFWMDRRKPASASASASYEPSYYPL